MLMSWLITEDPWWTYAVRGALTYLGLLLLMRLAGKRAFGDLSAFDVILLALAGGTLRTAVIGHDSSITSAFVGVISMLATDKALGWLSARYKHINRLFEGYPVEIVRNGRRVPEAMRRANLPDAALDRALHSAGRDDEADVLIGRLEPNGRITLIQRE